MWAFIPKFQERSNPYCIGNLIEVSPAAQKAMLEGSSNPYCIGNLIEVN